MVNYRQRLGEGISLIELHGKKYEVVEDVKNGFSEKALKDRYSDILSKYDYIVGDWGYEQLRLKGFYHDHQFKAAMDARIGTLEDYLYEHCNFGCSYFVIKKVV